MTEQTKNQTKTEETKEQTTDIKALLKEQEEKFKAELEKQREENQKQMDALSEKNASLVEELNNLKQNTLEENELLVQKIKAVESGKTVEPSYNPFKSDILYKVYNETAKCTTIMTGDEVQGIIGSIDKHLKQKLVNGEKKIEKHPYTITLIEKKNK